MHVLFYCRIYKKRTYQKCKVGVLNKRRQSIYRRRTSIPHPLIARAIRRRSKRSDSGIYSQNSSSENTCTEDHLTNSNNGNRDEPLLPRDVNICSTFPINNKDAANLSDPNTFLPIKILIKRKRGKKGKEMLYEVINKDASSFSPSSLHFEENLFDIPDLGHGLQSL